MSRFDSNRYFSLWQVDPHNRGREQELYLKLKELLLAASKYLCIPTHNELFFTHRMSLEQALELLAKALGMKTLGIDKFMKNAFLPLLARQGQELVLLLPYDENNYIVYGHSKPSFLIKNDRIGRQFKELTILYAAGAKELPSAQAFNRSIKAFLPLALIFFACVFIVAILGLSFSLAAILFLEYSPKNLVALMQAVIIGLAAFLVIEIFIVKTALKNMNMVKLSALSVLFHNVYSLSLREYVHNSIWEIKLLRTALLNQISRYFFTTPFIFMAWAFF